MAADLRPFPRAAEIDDAGPPFDDDAAAALFASEVDHGKSGPVNGAARLVAELATHGGFKLVSAADLYKPVPPAPFLVKGAIRTGSVVLITGFGGSKKTWLALDLALQVACGGNWLDRFPCSQGPVTIIDYESGLAELQRRIGARRRTMSSTVTPAIDAAVMPDVYMHHPAFASRILELAKSRSLIVIDSLAAGMPGVKENDSSMRVPLDACRRAGEATGCTFAIVAHAKKTSGKESETDLREAIRGSSAIYDAADTAFIALQRIGKPVRFVQTKSRHGVEIESLDVVVADRNGGIVIAAEDPPGTSRRAGNVTKWDSFKDEVVTVARRVCPTSKTAIAHEMNTGAKADRFKAIKELLEEGRLVEVGGQIRFQNRAGTDPISGTDHGP